MYVIIVQLCFNVCLRMFQLINRLKVIFSAHLNLVWVTVNDQCTYHSICFCLSFCEVIIMKIRFLISYFHNVMWFSMYDIECGIWWSLLKLGFYRNISKLLGGSYKVFCTHTVPWGLFLAKFLLGQLMQGQVWKLISNCRPFSSDVFDELIFQMDYWFLF